jgi:hypothetical protein
MSPIQKANAAVLAVLLPKKQSPSSYLAPQPSSLEESYAVAEASTQCSQPFPL